jgi:tripartite-type tricarboxylate transporter receptor subunit TctC
MTTALLRRAVATLTFSAALCVPLALPAAAQKADFSGQRVEIIVPFAPGGGSDVYARSIAPYLQKYLPGSPSVVIRNVPGGGAVVGANQFQARAKPDGLHAIVSGVSNLSSALFEKSKVQFQIERWEPVLLSPQGAVVYASTGLAVRDPRDILRLNDQKLVFGGANAAGADARVILSFALLGLKPTYVWGSARGPVRLAFERGEFNLNYDTAPAYLRNGTELVKAGKAAPLYSLGIFDAGGNVIRDPNFPDIPSFPELYGIVNGKPPSGPGYEAWRALALMGVMANKVVFLPAATPPHLVEAWRAAARSMLKDAEFEKKAAAVIEGYPQFIGEEARPVIRDATTISPAVMDWLRTYYRTQHEITLQ